MSGTELNLSGIEEVERVTALLLKQLRQEITDDELQELNDRMAANSSYKEVQDRVNNQTQLLADLIQLKQVDTEGWWQKISEQANLRVQRRTFLQRWTTYATAALLIIAAAFAYWFLIAGKKQQPTNEKYTPVIINILPGGNKASLTLSNGAVINLDNASKGMVAEDGNAKVMKLQNGQLEYQFATDNGQLANENHQTASVYNTLSTPKGGQYHLVLPDGSKVWLNAASSITYPTHFTGKERRVAITGEVYFEVSSLPLTPSGGGGNKIPFIVDITPLQGGRGAGRIEVLGTAFNINAYAEEEAIKTTLLRGKVKIVNGQWPMDNEQLTPGKLQTATLLPGQQAQLLRKATGALQNDSIKILDKVDTEMAIAWKNGLHSFRNADIKTIMRMLGRWYNIDIGYEGNIPDYKFTGSIPRSENISSVISMLEYAGIHFKLKDGHIVVIP